jgi:hypothetical protein
MTATAGPVADPVRAPDVAAPGRRLLLTLAIVFAAAFAALILSGSDNEPDAEPAALIADLDTSEAFIQWTSYAAMAACAVLIFFGAALRATLAGHVRRWTVDAAFIGFVALALVLASWTVSGLALWHAEDLGDPAAVRVLNLVDTSNFVPLMLAMICALVGTGVTALRTEALPTWLSVVSIVLGCLAPLGPAGFVPFMLFPVWMVVVAALVRLDPARSAQQ